MPELPEVETTACRLRPGLLGHHITNIRINWQRSLATHSPRDFYSTVQRATISAVLRRAKFVVIKLDLANNSSSHLLIHLRMSGSLEVSPASSPSPKHERIALMLSSGDELRFNDPRKFGRFYLVEDLAYFTRHLGPEPLDQNFSAQQFHQRLKPRRGRIKPLLLKQDFIAGIGNIYADEALWRAHISPLRRSETLSQARIEELLAAIRYTLKRAIRSAGTDSGDHVVKGGEYRPRVYGREGLACFRCGAKIRKIVLGQRGTHYCPKCQR